MQFSALISLSSVFFLSVNYTYQTFNFFTNLGCTLVVLEISILVNVLNDSVAFKYPRRYTVNKTDHMQSLALLCLGEGDYY